MGKLADALRLCPLLRRAGPRPARHRRSRLGAFPAAPPVPTASDTPVGSGIATHHSAGSSRLMSRSPSRQRRRLRCAPTVCRFARASGHGMLRARMSNRTRDLLPQNGLRPHKEAIRFVRARCAPQNKMRPPCLCLNRHVSLRIIPLLMLPCECSCPQEHDHARRLGPHRHVPPGALKRRTLGRGYRYECKKPRPLEVGVGGWECVWGERGLGWDEVRVSRGA